MQETAGTSYGLNIFCFAAVPSEAGETMRIEHYRLSRQQLDVSDAFALLSPSDKSSGTAEIKDLSRLEWVRSTARRAISRFY